MKLIFIAASDTLLHHEAKDKSRSKMPLFTKSMFQDYIYHQGLGLDFYGLVDYFSPGPESGKAGRLHRYKLPVQAGLHLAGYLDSLGLEYEIINHLDTEWERFKELYAGCAEPPLVGLSATYHLSWGSLRHVVETLRTVDPNMRIISGGAFYRAMILNGDHPAQWEPYMRQLQLEAVFYAMNSEGDLGQYLSSENCRGLEQIPNLAWFGPSGEFRLNEETRHEPIETVPPSSWGKLPFINQTLPLRSSTGCVFKCSYCLYPLMAHQYREISLDSIKKIIDDRLRHQPLKYLFFIDDAVNLSSKRLAGICEMLRPTGLQWAAHIRAGEMTADEAEMMRAAGCLMVALGVESGDRDILSLMRKKADPEKIVRGIGYLKRAGIRTYGTFIVGFPGETEDSAETTRQFIQASELDFFQLFPYWHCSLPQMTELGEKFNLQGSRYNWSHQGMTAKRAIELAVRWRAQINSPLHIVGGYYFIFTMLDAGFTFEETTRLQTLFNRMTAAQSCSEPQSIEPLAAQFAQVTQTARTRLLG